MASVEPFPYREPETQAQRDVNALYKVYGTVLNFNKRTDGKPISILDFGTGEQGVGRYLLNLRANQGRHLLVHDPYATPKRYPNSTFEVLSRSQVEERGITMDLVNLSFVLSTLPVELAQALLGEVKQLCPNSSIVVVDYILKNRARADVLNILDTMAEKKSREREGDDAFVANRTRHDIDDLAGLVQEAGWKPRWRNKLSDVRGAVWGVLNKSPGSVSTSLPLDSSTTPRSLQASLGHTPIFESSVLQGNA